LKEHFLLRRGQRKEDEKALADYESITSVSWMKARVPGDGGRERSIYNILEIMAVASRNTADFLSRAQAVLNVEDYGRLQRAVLHFEPLYHKIVWKPCLEGLLDQSRSLRETAARTRMASRLGEVARLMESAWPGDRPFVAALTPIPREPGKKLTLFGHCDGFLEVVEAPQHVVNIEEGMGVVFHELCHSLWSLRSRNVRAGLEKGFCGLRGAIAERELHEAIATALGNGWFQKIVSGKLPEKQWYNDEYTDGYARALLPLVLSYMEGKKPLDEDFALKATEIFEKRFPKAWRDPKVVFREIVVLSESREVSQEIFVRKISQTGHIHSVYTVNPLASPTGMKRLEENPSATAVFFLAPRDIEGLSSYGIDKSDVEMLSREAALKAPLSWCLEKSGRWIVVCIADSAEDQARIFLDLASRETLPDAGMLQRQK
jgi:hypothetical protein